MNAPAVLTTTNASMPVSRDAFVGIDQLVPLFDGRQVPYVNLDNAATTPAIRSRRRHDRARCCPFYSGVHRGTGHKSRLSTIAFELARELVGEFVGADPERDVVVFTKNTTEAINRLARSLPLADGRRGVDHRARAPLERPARGESRVATVHVGAQPDGTLDLDDLDRLPRRARRPGRAARRVGRVERHRRRAADPRPGRAGARRRWADPGRRRPACRRTARSTCGPTTIPVTSTSSPCRRTRCTPRSAAAR